MIKKFVVLKFMELCFEIEESPIIAICAALLIAITALYFFTFIANL